MSSQYNQQKRSKPFKPRNNRRGYDLPLHKKAGTAFVLWTIILMSFLCCLTLAGSLFLSNITASWEDNLKGQMTIEIKAQMREQETGPSFDEQAQKALNQTVLNLLAENYPQVSAQKIDDLEVFAMIEPWLGLGENTQSLQDKFPIPSLIALDFTPDNAPDLDTLEADLKAISGDIYLDTHEQWLGDIVALSHKIRNIGYLLALLIGLTAIAAVAGASRSRLTMHFAEIELLHLMGASDRYISKQFARHATWMSLEGCVVGVVMALSSVMLVQFLNDNSANIDSFLPHFSLDWHQWFMLALIPLVAGGIAYLTADLSSRSFLKRLP